MPRPKVPGAPEPKRRSRTGCWTCKAKKVKCGEEKPRCLNCERNGEQVCDYSIRLNWEGRTKRKGTSTPEPGNTVLDGLSIPKSSPGLSTLPFGEPGRSSASASPAFGQLDFSKVPRDFTSHGSGTSPFEEHSSHLSHSGSTTEVTSPDLQSETGQSFRHSGMPPPFNTDVFGKGSAMSSIHRPKRSRHGSASDVPFRTSTPDNYFSRQHHASMPGTSNPQSSGSMKSPPEGLRSTLSDSFLSKEGFPLTPSASSVNSEDYILSPSARESPLMPPYLSDPRRLSVNSLLIQEEENAKTRATDTGKQKNEDQFVSYGITKGLPDLDIPKNDDAHALDQVSPILTNAEVDSQDRDAPPEFGFGLSSNKITYYSDHVPVKLSRTLLPLPQLLLDNPMNLMYFHFFQEFTARILVPHDCPANPFKLILPQMAIRDDNLLHLLLAYSASHRARLLGHREPTNRIALWVKDVFPNLRHALEDPTTQISKENVATAIMLASLEIIAPNTFGVQIPWQDHLSIARRMIIARGGPRAINRERDRVSYFLIRWFAYLDVLGSFSRTTASPISLSSPSGSSRRPQDQQQQAMFSASLYDFAKGRDFQIDCVLGFSGFLAGILAKIADLARQCDAERIDPLTGNLNPGWQPAPTVVAAAEAIKADLEAARLRKYTICPHRTAGTESDAAWESLEIAATNEAFHWAGVVHLNRRVLGLPGESAEVQRAVREVIGSMYKVRKGGSAEACLVFPLFTAGCEARDESQREVLLERIRSVEESGMTQVHKARKLLESVWETGRPWETLVQGEFFG